MGKIMIDLERYHVAPGSYYVGKTEPRILQAFLGTCVGVAIYDSDNGIGGNSVIGVHNNTDCTNRKDLPQARRLWQSVPATAGVLRTKRVIHTR